MFFVFFYLYKLYTEGASTHARVKLSVGRRRNAATVMKWLIAIFVHTNKFHLPLVSLTEEPDKSQIMVTNGHTAGNILLPLWN